MPFLSAAASSLLPSQEDEKVRYDGEMIKNSPGTAERTPMDIIRGAEQEFLRMSFENGVMSPQSCSKGEVTSHCIVNRGNPDLISFIEQGDGGLRFLLLSFSGVDTSRFRIYEFPFGFWVLQWDRKGQTVESISVYSDNTCKLLAFWLSRTSSLKTTPMVSRLDMTELKAALSKLSIRRRRSMGSRRSRSVDNHARFAMRKPMNETFSSWKTKVYTVFQLTECEVEDPFLVLRQRPSSLGTGKSAVASKVTLPGKGNRIRKLFNYASLKTPQNKGEADEKKLFERAKKLSLTDKHILDPSDEGEYEYSENESDSDS